MWWRGIRKQLFLGEKEKSGGSWRLHHFLCEIRTLVRELKTEVLLGPREQNSLADKLAKWSASQHHVFIGDHILDC